MRNLMNRFYLKKQPLPGTCGVPALVSSRQLYVGVTSIPYPKFRIDDRFTLHKTELPVG